ncbi:hypothetical protein H4R35_007568, partial [Dimargaris xerosporica]
WQALWWQLLLWVKYLVFDWWFECLVLALDHLHVLHFWGFPSRSQASLGAPSTAGWNPLGQWAAYQVVLTRVLTPALMVYLSEMMADWTKHAFITKFNTIRPEIYGRYTDILCRDLVGIEEDADRSNEPEPTAQSSHSTQAANPTASLLEDQVSTDSAQPLHPGSAMRRTPSGGRSKIRVERSLAVGNRIGLATLPLACLAIRNVVHIVTMVLNLEGLSHDADDVASESAALSGWSWDWLPTVLGSDYLVYVLLGLMAYVLLVFLKLLIGMNLVQYAWRRYRGLKARQREEEHSTKHSVSRVEAQREWQQLQADVNDPKEQAEKRRRLAKITVDNIDRYTLFKNRIP